MNKAKNIQQRLIEQSKIIHKNKYDYNLVNYIKYTDKVTIICSNHGEFKQQLHCHAIGRGCLKCGLLSAKLKTSFSNEYFVENSNKIHNNNYDYSKTFYTGYDKKVIITCYAHGDFQQTARHHLKGHGCKKCFYKNGAGKSKKVKAKINFINKISKKIINFENYDFSITDYISYTDKVKVICKTHGLFECRASTLINGSGCTRCGSERSIKSSTYTNQEFVDKSNLIHDNKYDYSLVEYINCSFPVKIICNNHKLPFVFTQKPKIHFFGSGCTKCFSNVSKPETLWLDGYSIQEQYRQFKIKINNKSFNVDGYDPITNTVYEFYGDYWHGNPKIYNPKDINKRSKKTFGELYQVTINRECLLKLAGYNLITTWENHK